MRKPAFCRCESKAADQRLCFRYTDRTIPLLSISENFKPLATFCGCTARFVSDLDGNPEERFSYNEAHLILSISIVFVDVQVDRSLTWSETRDAVFFHDEAKIIQQKYSNVQLEYCFNCYYKCLQSLQHYQSSILSCSGPHILRLVLSGTWLISYKVFTGTLVSHFSHSKMRLSLTRLRVS